MTIFFQIVAIAILATTLSISTRFLISAFKKISQQSTSSDFALSSLIIGMGTSIPEIIIAIGCALRGKPNLSLGNVLGSNIANLSLIIGGATLIAGQLKIIDSVLKSNIYYAFLIAAAPLLLLSDGQLTRLDGIILLLLYLSWQNLMFVKKQQKQESLFKRLKNKAPLIFSSQLSPLKIIMALIALLGSAELMVRIVISLATQLNVPGFLLGVFILGAGSSLPELAFSTQAIKDKESAIVLGDLLGSVVTNSSFIVGLTVLISPLRLFHPKQYFTVTLYFLITFLIFYIFIKTKKRLEKWEAAFLVASYFILLVFEFG